MRILYLALKLSAMTDQAKEKLQGELERICNNLQVAHLVKSHATDLLSQLLESQSAQVKAAQYSPLTIREKQPSALLFWSP